MAGNQERQFRFGAIVHEDYQELAMLLPKLEDRLNQNINLKGSAKNKMEISGELFWCLARRENRT